MKLKAWKTAVALALKKTPRTAPEFAKLPEHVAIIMDGNGRYGLADSEGKPLTGFVYDDVEYVNSRSVDTPFVGGEYIRVRRNGKWGILARDGKEVVAAKYEALGVESEGLISFRQNGSGVWFASTVRRSSSRFTTRSVRSRAVAQGPGSAIATSGFTATTRPSFDTAARGNLLRVRAREAGTRNDGLRCLRQEASARMPGRGYL